MFQFGVAVYFLVSCMLHYTMSYRLPAAVRPRTHTQLAAKLNLEDLKNKLMNTFDSDLLEDSIFSCPESLRPLKLKQRVFGKITESSLIEPEFGKTYDVLPGRYYDLTVKKEQSKSFFGLSKREKVGQKLFQTKLLSAIYERGYRQNFQNFGFPGIDKEFEEAKDFFLEAGATGTVVDLSCGSGFMTRKFINASV
jgi:hypothetical protein